VVLHPGHLGIAGSVWNIKLKMEGISCWNAPHIRRFELVFRSRLMIVKVSVRKLMCHPNKAAYPGNVGTQDARFQR